MTRRNETKGCDMSLSPEKRTGATAARFDATDADFSARFDANGATAARFDANGADFSARCPDLLHILYEDNHLLVVEKPVNMPVQADSSGDPDLLSALKAYVKHKYEKPGEVYLGLVHRLDRPVGGVMVFARTSKAAARLSEQFQKHIAKKRYAAVVLGTALPAAQLTDFLRKDEETFSSAVVSEDTPGAKSAKLCYALLSQRGGRSLLDVELFTGRAHQIRVQLAHAGLPIAGDQRYNAAARPGEQIALWAYALSLRHPTLNEEMTFTLQPQGEAFAQFQAQTALLPAFAVCRGVYLDETLLVADKNAGVEVEGELLSELTALALPGGDGALYPVHRLDANTEGLVAFARTQAMRERLERLFYTHALTKIYHAVVRGTPSASGELVHFIVKDSDEARVRLCAEGEKNALRCALTYRTLASDGEKSLVEITLLTGRTHQIRVQMAAAGYPVLGDDKYGDRAFNKLHHARVQQLLAKRLELDGHVFESTRTLTL